MKSSDILAELKARKQKATEGVGKGKKIPQIAITENDIEKALSSLNGVTEDYLNQPGFLTTVYLNGAKRTGKDITNIREGLFVAFV
ncbi:MAG: hypothetical protein COA50_01195 [Flavobacteriaceae bacterium]|nr:MAG: hypothetical protein COA50_01195 [Flavobacteriaceae bacterium]